jgi:hypothetical protein
VNARATHEGGIRLAFALASSHVVPGVGRSDSHVVGARPRGRCARNTRSAADGSSVPHSLERVWQPYESRSPASAAADLRSSASARHGRNRYLGQRVNVEADEFAGVPLNSGEARGDSHRDRHLARCASYSLVIRSGGSDNQAIRRERPTSLRRQGHEDLQPLIPPTGQGALQNARADEALRGLPLTGNEQSFLSVAV